MIASSYKDAFSLGHDGSMMPLPRPCVRGVVSRAEPAPAPARAAGAAPKEAYDVESAITLPARRAARSCGPRSIPVTLCTPTATRACPWRGGRAHGPSECSRQCPATHHAGERRASGLLTIRSTSGSGHAGDAHLWARVWAPPCARVRDQHAGVRCCGALGRRWHMPTAGRTPTGHGHAERRGTHRTPNAGRRLILSAPGIDLAPPGEEERCDKGGHAGV